MPLYFSNDLIFVEQSHYTLYLIMFWFEFFSIHENMGYVFLFALVSKTSYDVCSFCVLR